MSRTRDEDMRRLNQWISASVQRGALAILTHRNGDIDTSQIKSIKEGSVLIFPYTFQHFVIPVMKTRVSIAYNLASY